jgi:hypothetical protein
MALPFDKASEIAERHIRDSISASDFLSRHQFGETGLQSENDRFWTFVRGSDQLFDEGYVPGAVYACVDKVDGHVLNGDEVEQFYWQKPPLVSLISGRLRHKSPPIIC